MEAERGKSPFELIVGLHDVAEEPDARDDELASWMPFSEVEPVLGRLLAASRRTGTPGWLAVSSATGPTAPMRPS